MRHPDLEPLFSYNAIRPGGKRVELQYVGPLLNNFMEKVNYCTATPKALSFVNFNFYFTQSTYAGYFKKESIYISRGSIINCVNLSLIAKVHFKKSYKISPRIAISNLYFYRNSCLVLYINNEYVGNKKYEKLISYLLSLGNRIEIRIVKLSVIKELNEQQQN